MYNLPEKTAPGGRVYAMTATGEIEKRIWIGTSVSPEREEGGGRECVFDKRGTCKLVWHSMKIFA